MSDPFLGQISMFGFNWAVRGWANCDGQLMPIAQNSALFSLLGTTYGGDGRTTFGLPDLRGRVPVHHGSGPGLSNYRIGQKGGEETHTLVTSEMPSHSHASTITTKVVDSAGTTDSPNGAYPAQGPGAYATSPGLAGFGAFAPDQTAVTLSDNGGGLAHNNLQPYQTIGFEIALQGLYPSRS